MSVVIVANLWWRLLIGNVAREESLALHALEQSPIFGDAYWLETACRVKWITAYASRQSLVTPIVWKQLAHLPLHRPTVNGPQSLMTPVDCRQNLQAMALSVLSMSPIFGDAYWLETTRGASRPLSPLGGRQSLVTPIDWKRVKTKKASGVSDGSVANLWRRLLNGNVFPRSLQA